MRSFRFPLIFLLLFGFFGPMLQAKNELQFGFAQPTGDFVDDDSYSAITGGSGAATTGFYLGYKLLTPLGSKELYWTISAGIVYNELNGNFKADMEDDLMNSDYYGENLKSSFCKYLNIPIMAGLQYEKIISSNTKMFGEVGLGINYLKMTGMSFNWDYFQSGQLYNFDLAYEFKPSIQLGYKIGGGILIDDKYTIGITYLDLGSHKLKYQISSDVNGETNESDEMRFDKALSISSFNVTCGIRF